MLEYFKIFLPIGGFSLAIFLSPLIRKEKNDLLISNSLILMNSLVIAYYNLGFSELEINSYQGNILLISLLVLQSMILCFYRIYIFSLGLLIGLLEYNLNLYNSQIFSLYLVDGFTILLSFTCLTYELFKRRKSF